ncbi:MAG: hypothetical protein ABSB24_01155 [Gaiellaceae bacterium]|jgi:hypothetical protein
MSDVLAIYGAVAGSLGTAGGLTALGWNIWSWHRGHATRVVVEVREGIIAPPEGTRHVVLITAINYSEHPIQVKAVGVECGGQTIQVFHQSGEIPGKIEARDSATTWLPRDMPELTERQVAGWVRVGTREVYSGEPYMLAR